MQIQSKQEAKELSANQEVKNFIVIHNARVHNLKNLSVKIPRNKFTVITGVSGSGKSSLAFDTLYAEGQRRYAESLSSYVRQFIGRMDKPEVDFIRGISPAIAIEQKVNTRNPRSTVGTSTEIYDYLKLLYARIGKTFSPVSGKQVKRDTVSDVVDFMKTKPVGTKCLLLSPLKPHSGRNLADELGILMQKGFSRIYQDGEVKKIEDAQKEAFAAELDHPTLKKEAEEKPKKAKAKKNPGKAASDEKSPGAPGSFNQKETGKHEPLFILVDRFVTSENDEDLLSRMADSVQTAFSEGNGECSVEIVSENKKTGASRQDFSNRFESEGIVFEEPTVHLFSFNNPYGACKRCEGFGQIIGTDESLVIPDRNLSVFDGAIACWRGEKMSEWNEELILNAYKFDFPIHRPFRELTKEQQELVWTGNAFFKGLNKFFKYLEEQSYKIQYRVMLSRYRGRTVCPECKGTRLRKESSYVKVCGRSISEIVLMQIKDALKLFSEIESGEIELSKEDKTVSKRILMEITNRLRYLEDVGLGYLTMNRLSNTLSGGESQRINLATALGSSLVGSMYILDEPSIGLHPRDTQRLIGILLSLRDLGNTVIVVEHDEDIMRAADHLIDLGPGAGSNGGELMYSGNLEDLFKSEKSLTAKFLAAQTGPANVYKRRSWKKFIQVNGASENNLKDISVKFPLETMTVISGVSGSGKSTLVKSILYPGLKKIIQGFGENPGRHDSITGDTASITAIEFIDQNPIGKSSRSNPVTYVKAYDEIRNFYSSLPLAVTRGYKPSHFSFNVDGGRCEVCEGTGEVVIEMQFMADIHLRCEGCNGKQFREEILEVTYEGKNISDVLAMTVDESIDFFGLVPGEKKGKSSQEEKIISKIQPLSDVGLGYVRLGQPASTLSGGEAQRIKLASFFGNEGETGRTLFLFDEPTTGLHFHDIKKLLYCFNRLIDNGHSVFIIEHNPEILRHADWLIDLGPDGGDGGGQVVFTGTPEDLILCKNSVTGRFLKL